MGSLADPISNWYGDGNDVKSQKGSYGSFFYGNHLYVWESAVIGKIRALWYDEK